MKKLFFTAVAFCTIQLLFAQSPKSFVSDSSKPIIQQQLLFQNRIIGKTDKGTVYALPQDNMPVLVPDSSVTSNMPNRLKTETPGLQMPNPYYPGKPQMNKRPTFDSLLKVAPPLKYEYKQKPAIKQ
jgi:hypothetical protein